MRKKDRFKGITDWCSANMADAASELHFASAYQLLVAVVLSAQCTDKRVNMVTPALFKAYPDPASLSDAAFEDVYELIRSISYPNAKARHLIAMAQRIVSDFSGEVPQTVEQLQSLPGVGRKTANVVASICFGAPVIAVDTHVFRVAGRLGLSDGRTVEKVESDLTEGFPEQMRSRAHHWLILHGRYVCTARHPLCGDCGLKPWCRHYSKEQKNTK